MNNPQNLTHPEIGPRNSGTPVDSIAGATSGVIVFNRPSLPSEDPKVIIREAIASGDTGRERAKQFREAMLPEQE